MFFDIIKYAGFKSIHLFVRSLDEADKWRNYFFDEEFYLHVTAGPTSESVINTLLSAGIDDQSEIGILHAAMSSYDSNFENQCTDRVSGVFDAKLGILFVIQSIIKLFTVRKLLILTSAAAELGNPGQSAYNATNSSLESWILKFQRAGVEATALQLSLVDERNFPLIHRQKMKRSSSLFRMLTFLDLGVARY